MYVQFFEKAQPTQTEGDFVVEERQQKKKTTGTRGIVEEHYHTRCLITTKNRHNNRIQSTKNQNNGGSPPRQTATEHQAAGRQGHLDKIVGSVLLYITYSQPVVKRRLHPSLTFLRVYFCTAI